MIARQPPKYDEVEQICTIHISCSLIIRVYSYNFSIDSGTLIPSASTGLHHLQERTERLPHWGGEEETKGDL